MIVITVSLRFPLPPPPPEFLGEKWKRIRFVKEVAIADLQTEEGMRGTSFTGGLSRSSAGDRC